jgi:hypothetical protein
MWKKTNKFVSIKSSVLLLTKISKLKYNSRTCIHLNISALPKLECPYIVEIKQIYLEYFVLIQV